MTDGLPAPLWASLKAFLGARKTGQVVLDVKDGRVLAYKLTECGRCDGLIEPVGADARGG